MNPINRIGQKVVCVVPEIYWRVQFCPTLQDYPTKGKVYTVTGFAPWPNGSVPGIHLREIAGFSCACAEWSGLSWPIVAFKPLEEKKTDIGIFTEMLKTDKEDA